MDSSQYADLFLTESREHVTAINQWLLQLERDGATGSAEPVSAIFRAVHTVKGMSATMGYVVVAELFANAFALRLVTTSSEAEIERVTRGAGDVAAVQIGEDVAQSAGQAIPAVEGRRAAGLPAGTAASDGSVGGGAPRAPRTTQAVPMPNAS